MNRQKLKTASLLVLGLSACSLAGPVGESSRVPHGASPATFIARSDDGLRFREPEFFLSSAGAPALGRLPNGNLIAVVRFADSTNTRGSTSTFVSVSRDDGASWSKLAPMRIRGLKKSWEIEDFLGFVREVDGNLLRLHMNCRRKTAASADPHQSAASLLVSATTSDGVTYQVDRASVTRMPRGVRPKATARLADTVLMFADPARERPRASDAQRELHRFTSQDGRRFARERQPARIASPGFDAVLAVHDRLRMYAASPEGILSFVSRDGVDWQREPGARLVDAVDPTAVQARGGSIIMLFARNVPEGAPSLAPIVAPPPVDVITPEPDEEDADEEFEADASTLGFEEPTDEERDAPPVVVGITALDEEASDDENQAEPAAASPQMKEHAVDAPSPKGEPLQTEAEGADATIAVVGWNIDHGSGLGMDSGFPFDDFAPPPDATQTTDYVNWFVEQTYRESDDNAFEAYESVASLVPAVDAESEERPAVYRNMFENADAGPPAPWNPVDHPDWDEAGREIVAVLEGYENASRKPEYVRRISWSETADADGDQPLLIGLVLPQLAPMRTLSKATIARAWRSEGGKPSPQKMRGAFETVLRTAEHVGGESTLIEQLVAFAMRRFTFENARWALAHGVFETEQELEAMLALLQRYSRDSTDFVRAVRAEHAMSMDTIQFLFSPPGPDGEPQLNLERVGRAYNWFGEDADKAEAFLGKLKEMDAGDMQRTVDALTEYYRKLSVLLSVGYPRIRAADVDGITERYLHATPLTEVLLPSLSRVLQLRARAIANARATELAFALHLFHEREQRWPARLRDLPKSYGTAMRIDPFTGRDFGYQLTEDGPVVYSLSENAVDDGGVHNPRWSDRSPPSAEEADDEAIESDDFVFWPPQG